MKIYSGTGNTFLIFDNREGNVREKDKSNFVQDICVQNGKKVDGAIFLEQSKNYAFFMSFYNNDGTKAAFCGNGARCIAYYAYKNHIAPKKMIFDSLAGTTEAEILNDNFVKIKMPTVKDIQLNKVCHCNGKTLNYSFINTGVEHVVTFVDKELTDEEVFKYGREIRYNNVLFPQGTNVNFVEILEKGKLFNRTYEKGVEAETKACGTGATACAVIYAKLQGYTKQVEVNVLGGTLFVEMDENYKNIYLIGKVKILNIKGGKNDF